MTRDGGCSRLWVCGRLWHRRGEHGGSRWGGRRRLQIRRRRVGDGPSRFGSSARLCVQGGSSNCIRHSWAMALLRVRRESSDELRLGAHREFKSGAAHHFLPPLASHYLWCYSGQDSPTLLGVRKVLVQIPARGGRRVAVKRVISSLRGPVTLIFVVLCDGNWLAGNGAKPNRVNQEGRRKPPLFAFADGFGIGGARTTGAVGVDGVGGRAVGRGRELEPRGLCHLRDGNRLRRNGPQGEQGERRGKVDAAVLAFVDLFGIGGGARTTGAAGVDGVGVGAVGRERELDRRGLLHVREGNWLMRKGA